MAKDTYYFSHDYHSRTDPKILRMIKDGWDNYGLWWAIIEMLHEQKGYLPTDYSNIAYELRTDCERITKVIESYDLFLIKDGRFTSQRVIDNLKYREDKSTKASASANVRWHNANALQTHSEGNAIKGKERKGNKRIFKTPTLEEVCAYCLETKSNIDPEHFFNTYASQGWIKANGLPIQNWKLTIKTWERKRGIMEQQNVCLSDMAEEFYKQDKLDRVDEILQETRILKEFQHLMVKHAMDSMSEVFQEFYYSQEKFLKKLKKEYQEKYGI